MNNVFRFDEKSFLKTTLGVSPHWDYKQQIGYRNENEKKI